MNLSFSSDSPLSLLNKIDSLNTIHSASDGILKAREINVIQGVVGVFMRSSLRDKLVLAHTPAKIASTRTVLCVFSGDRYINALHINSILLQKKEWGILFEDTQEVTFSFPANFNGVCCLYIFDQKWRKENKLESLKQLPQYLSLLSSSITDLKEETGSSILKENGLITEVFFKCLLQLTEKENQGESDARTIERIGNFLSEQLSDQQPTLKDLAKLANMSVSTLKRQFKKHQNTTIGAFFTKEKMKHARELLENGSSIKVVAAKLGYKAPQSFSQAFYRSEGVLPSSILKAKTFKK